MESKKSFWTSITGGLTSAAPVLLSCCKSGACVGVCASPIASLFGVSSATLANSPVISALEPVLIAISAVSFTVSYYSLYVLPKFNCNTSGGCACEPTAKEKRKVKINKAVFWIGLVLSIGFLSYFEISKYRAATAQNTECSTTTECAPGTCSEEPTKEENGTSSCDSASACCEKDDKEKTL
jgi:formate hydrogenlyase subunit 3/multisubunit Na+/H+ antiporter MnhD subunit